jgi:glycosyltransferase involved in cell wall biosynthesis
VKGSGEKLSLAVVLATYNGQRFLRQQIDSLAAQTRTPDEVVIVDDCSSDDTVALIERFKVDHGLTNWQVHRGDRNLGFIKNFHRGMALSRADVVLFCDQDDVWQPDKVEVVARSFETDPSLMALNTAFEVIDAQGVIAGDGREWEPHPAVVQPAVSRSLEACLAHNVSPGCTMGVRRQVVDLYLARSRCVMPHDWELNVLAALLGGLRFMDVPLVAYRIHGANTIGFNADSLAEKLHARERQAVEYRDYLLSLHVYLDLMGESTLRTYEAFTRSAQARVMLVQSGRGWAPLVLSATYRSTVSPGGRVLDAAAALLRLVAPSSGPWSLRRRNG